MGIGLREIHSQITLWRDRHAPNNDIELLGNQRRDDATPCRGNELYFDPHVSGNFCCNIDFKADQVSLFITHCPRHKGGHTNPQSPTLLYIFDNAISNDRRCCGQGTECAYKYST